MYSKCRKYFVFFFFFVKKLTYEKCCTYCFIGNNKFKSYGDVHFEVK